MLRVRGAVAALLGLGLAVAVVAPGQSPGGKPQQKQTQPAPDLPPWDSAQPPPPIRPPSPEDAKPDPDDGPPIRSEDAAPDPVEPAPAASSAQPAQTTPAPVQEAAKPAPPADPPPDEAPRWPPSADPAQRRMEKDTAELLRLSRELKAEVNKAGSNTLSVAAVQKADEIQRLVKSLKEQMRERGLVVANKP
jgi:hypothetical protein